MYDQIQRCETFENCVMFWEIMFDDSAWSINAAQLWQIPVIAQLKNRKSQRFGTFTIYY
jgi:hypothetical protein